MSDKKSEKRKVILGDPVFDNKNFFSLSCYLTKNESNQDVFYIKHGAWLGSLVIMIAIISSILMILKFASYNISWFMALSPWIGFFALILFLEVFKTVSIEKIRENEKQEQEQE